MDETGLLMGLCVGDTRGEVATMLRLCFFFRRTSRGLLGACCELCGQHSDPHEAAEALPIPRI